MAKAKEDRYPTAGELVRALRAVALGTTGVRETTRFDAPPPGGPPPAETVLARPEPPPPAAAPPPPPTEPPAPAEPPSEPEPGPPPVPRKEPRTVTLSGSRLALLVGGLVALVAAAVVAALVLSGGGEKNAAATTTGTTTPTATTTQGVTSVAVGLAGVVPKPIFKYCTNAAKAPGAAQTVTCSPPAAAGGTYYPNSWQLSLYPSAAALRSAYDALRHNNDIGANFGRCSGIEWGGEAGWAHGPGKPGGREFCYFDGNVAVIVWTHEKLGQPSHIDLLGIARSNGSDHSNLFNWFRFWHHRIGKCAVPDCVARLV
jgi:hypothetical protein